MEISVKPWLTRYPKEIPHTIEYSEKPLQQYLEEAARECPDKVAVHFLGKDANYAELYEQAMTMAHYLQKLGLKKGDRVAIMLPNCPQAVVGYYGTLFAGGVVVQTNPLYTERELEHQMKDSGANIIIALNLLYPRIMKVKAVTKIKHIILTGIADALPFPKNLLYPFVEKKQNKIVVQVEPTDTVHLFKQIMKHKNSTKIDLEINVRDDVALLQYTGGTTGFPKAAMLTHFNLSAQAEMVAKWVCYDGKDRVILGALPFFHVFGMTTVMNLGIIARYKMALVPKFEVEMMLKTIQSQRTSVFPGAPTMYIALLNSPLLKKYDISSIEVCVSGSAPLPLEIQEQFEKVTGGKLVEGYGLTETSPVTHANLVWEAKEDRITKGSIGLPWPDTDAKIVTLDEAGVLNEVAIGEIGELAVKGPQVMKGYWNRPEETATVLHDGWFLTGDIGKMDEHGYFYIVDRKKDMVIAGGYNIYPREVEEVLFEHPSVLEAAAVGVPDAYRGETIKAFIVLKDGATCTEAELNKFMRERLAVYKVPRLYEFRKELPKTTVGKVLRRVLAEEEKEKQAR